MYRRLGKKEKNVNNSLTNKDKVKLSCAIDIYPRLSFGA